MLGRPPDLGNELLLPHACYLGRGSISEPSRPARSANRFVVFTVLVPETCVRVSPDPGTHIPLYQGLASSPLPSNESRLTRYTAPWSLGWNGLDRVVYLAERSRAVPQTLLLRPTTRQSSRLMKKYIAGSCSRIAVECLATMIRSRNRASRLLIRARPAVLSPRLAAARASLASHTPSPTLTGSPGSGRPVGAVEGSL